MITKSMQDYQDIQLFTTLYVGSEKQPLKMIFDSGSNWFWVQSEKCSDCSKEDKYRTGESTTFNSFGYENKLKYGSGTLTGVVAEDTVCLSAYGDQCIKGMNMIEARGMDGLQQIQASGLVGLSPMRFEEEADLFVLKMKEVAIIDEAVFSLFINTADD